MTFNIIIGVANVLPLLVFGETIHYFVKVVQILNLVGYSFAYLETEGLQRLYHS